MNTLREIRKAILFTIAKNKTKQTNENFEINLRKGRTSTVKTSEHWRRKLKKTLEGGQTFRLQMNIM